MDKIENRRKALSFAIGFSLGAMMAISPAAWSSGLPDISAFDNASEVPDNVLGSMRGRFISRDQIVQFGVEMSIIWQTAQGEILQAAANFNVSHINGSLPTFTFAPNLTIVSPEILTLAPVVSNISNLVSSNSGLRNVTGVAQTIQVAGDDNVVGQDTNFVITSLSLPVPRGGSSLPGTQTVTSGSGASVSASLGSNGVSVEARIPNQGEVIQQIRGTGFSGQSAAGVIQSTQLGTDMQHIRSTINIAVQVLPGTSLGAARVGASMQNMQGLRPLGAY